MVISLPIDPSILTCGQTSNMTEACVMKNIAHDRKKRFMSLGESSMKKYCISFVLCMLFLAVATAPSAEAQDQKKLGVLPFAIHSSENLDYVKSGVWDMLISRLSAAGGIDVADKADISAVLEARGKEDLVAADVYEIGQSLGLDYVVWGSITKIGNSVSLDGKLFDVSANATTVSVDEQTRGMDDVIPKIGDFSRRISAHLKGEEVALAPSPARPSPERAPAASPPVAEEKARTGEPVDVLRSERGTLTSIVNPAFILRPDVLDREGFIMSNRYPRKFKGMDIGDVDGDGKNDVVVIDRNNIFIYQFREEGFVLKNTISGRSSDNHISVDVADINGSGRPEIIVTNMRRDVPNSFIIEYRDGAFVTIAENLRWFLRVIESPDGPILMGQRVGMNRPFDNPIHEIVWENESMTEGRRLPIPQGLPVFGTTLASLDGGRTERVIALDEYDRLNIYQRTTRPLQQIHVLGRGGTELLWRSEDPYGGSDNVIPFSATSSSLDQTRDVTEDNVYANVRILTYDLKGDGKEEIILVSNLSAVGRIVKNVKAFTRSEIHGFEWDGMGIIENWKTRTIQGYVTDYQFKDLNNDGRKQIVLALVLQTSQSVIVAYDLNL